MIYELRHYDTPTDRDLAALTIAFEQEILPAWAAAQVEAVGFWTVLVGPYAPRLTCILRWETLTERDQKWRPPLDAAPFTCAVTNAFLRALPSSPDARHNNQPPRLAGGVFEWRVLSFQNSAHLSAFADWLATGGYAHFERHNLHMMGAWDTVVGTQPRVSYMTVFENLAHRERAWAAFYTDPAWPALEERLYPNGDALIRHTASCLMKGTEFSGWR